VTAHRVWAAAALAGRDRSEGPSYREFLRVPSMSAGVYVLAAGATDRQSPHSEDELYVVVQGHGRFRHGAADDEAAPGRAFFVPAREEHRFYDITEELVLWVVFSPSESAAPAAGATPGPVP
jgi:mannose-6-phosphate isomerase-like protein (cupin superfamily)